jgi:hypothetical protein
MAFGLTRRRLTSRLVVSAGRWTGSAFLPIEPKQLRVDGYDERACRHEACPNGGRHHEAGAKGDAGRHGGWQPRCKRSPRSGFALSSRKFARDRPRIVATSLGSLRTSTTSADSTATSVPAPMATPRSASTSAGASLTPSPIMATRKPRSRSCLIFAAF